VQAPEKMDLPGRWSYQLSWAPMWQQALGFAVPEKVTPQEKAWDTVVKGALPRLQAQLQEESRKDARWQPARLEWAKRLNRDDLRMLDGAVRFDREADPAAVQQLKILRGHLREGQWITKVRKIFRHDEMTQDLEFTRAMLGSQPDEMEYVFILPTSPP
jgi:hypothetical protein